MGWDKIENFAFSKQFLLLEVKDGINFSVFGLSWLPWSVDVQIEGSISSWISWYAWRSVDEQIEGSVSSWISWYAWQVERREGRDYPFFLNFIYWPLIANEIYFFSTFLSSLKWILFYNSSYVIFLPLRDSLFYIYFFIYSIYFFNPPFKIFSRILIGG